MALPTVAEVRAKGQPQGLLDRNSGEHWAGRLYIRRVSPVVTRLLLATPATPNFVTWLMILCGVGAGAALSVPELWGAVAAFVLIQLQILFDCSDGELARWKGISSATGVYLDRLGHFITGAALPIGLGVRADGGWDSLGGYTSLGLLIALLVVFLWSQSALVHVARADAGLAAVEDRADVAAPRASGLARLRRMIGVLPFYRAFVAMETTLLALAAAIADAGTDSLDGTRFLVVAMVPLAAITFSGRLAAILLSSRLR